MSNTTLARSFRIVLPILGTLMFLSSRGAPAERDCVDSVHSVAQQILRATGINGGLIVHLGCGDGRLTAALHTGNNILVQGLDADSTNVEQARAHVRSLGLCGPVAIDQSVGGRLPYVDNLVNLIIVDDSDGTPMDEVMRVLCPNGVAYIQQDAGWKKVTKTRSARLDEWTHFLHDATNNAVAQDTVAGPPMQLQWVGNPKWARSHDHLASVSGVVSAGGRLFYIVDEGPTAAVILQPKWKLVARDAFNGVVLWKRPIDRWQWHLRGFRSGPADLARRLVAVGDRVFVTLDIDGPLCALDAVTGQTVMTYDSTHGTQEVVHANGILYVVVGLNRKQAAVADANRRRGLASVRPQRPAYPETMPRRYIVAIESRTGRQLWKKADTETAELMPTALAVSQDRVFFENPDKVICADAKTGTVLWQADRPTARVRPTWSAPTLVVYNNVVLSADRAATSKPRPNDPQPRADAGAKVEWTVSSAGGLAPEGRVIAFSVEDGRQLWSCKCREGYNSPVDVLVAGGLVWTGNVVRAREPGITEGRDPKTGQVKRTRPADQTFFAPGMGHGRCYRNKATSRYLVVGRSGTEFIDIVSGVSVPNHWVRGTCQYGVIPCNGLLYAPPESCACFIASKINGFDCLAPRRPSQRVIKPAPDRLLRGPAFDSMLTRVPNPKDVASDDWPTYRHDGARSGHTTAAVSAELEPKWQTNVGGKLSSIVVADGKLLVAAIDAHTVHALDATNGRPLWDVTVGGRVDSPPTVWHRRAFFGSADGYVYCLRLSDGALIWRFRAAPRDQRIVAGDQVESLWPVPGNVLVRDGVALFVAGRSSYLEGAIRLIRLDATTGKLLSETVVDDRDPKTGYQRKGVVHGTNMPGALPDVLSCDGTSVFMRHVRFDLQGRRQDPTVAHLFGSTGFLDDSWWHRTYWFLGTKMGTNYGGWPRMGDRVPAGRLLVMDDTTVYGFGRNWYAHFGSHIGIDAATVFHYNPQRDARHRETHYRAFAMARHVPSQPAAPAKKGRKGKRRVPAPAKQYRWTEELPILARAMVLTDKTLFLAGPPSIFDTDDPVAAIEGNKGGTICALSPKDGRLLAQYQLEHPPVFDGVAATDGNLFLATTKGQIVCMGQ